MKKIINYVILFVSLFFISITVKAYPITYDRTLSNNYGVNKKWQVNSYNESNVINTPYVDASEKIYDFSEILTEEEKDKLIEKINEFRTKYNTELIILTYDLSYISDYDNEKFASDFYDYNDFGIDFEKYNGILLFRNTYSADKYYDIYTFGDAQLYFDSSRYNEILDGIYNYLSNGFYYDGFSKFIDYINEFYEDGKPSSLKKYLVDDNGYLYQTDSKGINYYYDDLNDKYYYYDENNNIKEYKKPYLETAPIFPSLIISLIITIIVIAIMIKKNFMVKKAYQASEYINNENYTVRRDDFITSHTSSYTIDTSSGSSGGGGHSSHSGSSGGGHSSGGGRHG